MMQFRAVLLAALLLAIGSSAVAAPKVVSDEVCRLNPPLVCEFATCDSDKTPTPIGVDPPGAYVPVYLQPVAGAADRSVGGTATHAPKPSRSAAALRQIDPARASSQ